MLEILAQDGKKQYNNPMMPITIIFPGGREEEHDYFFIVMFWICVLVYIMHLSTLQKYVEMFQKNW